MNHKEAMVIIVYYEDILMGSESLTRSSPEAWVL